MNALRFARRACIVALTMGMVFGCFLTRPITVLPAQRVDAFLASLNAADHSTVYLNIDPGVANYDLMIDETYWNGDFPVSGPGMISMRIRAW